uniref:Uncharacterized protein n=1 Tax=Oryza sativa subsp. japonica TaxID=39947 RepID=Q6ZKQ8_ORYSJ|nr:hypothetical protein [Oryza sativa Japonica Group]
MTCSTSASTATTRPHFVSAISLPSSLHVRLHHWPLELPFVEVRQFRRGHRWICADNALRLRLHRWSHELATSTATTRARSATVGGLPSSLHL